MEHYRRHFWSLFLEFIELFEQMTYRGIPLPLLANFNYYVHADRRLVWRMMEANFLPFLKKPISSQAEIQPAFDARLKSTGQLAPRKNPNGHILIHHGSVTRFPPGFMEAFHAGNSALIPGDITGVELPFHVQLELQKITAEYLAKAEATFAAYSDHPAFGNEAFQQKYYRDIPLMLQHIEAAHRQLDLHAAASCLLVGTTEFLPERVLAIAAGQKGIPSICFQHGVMMGEPSFMPVFATRQAVYGQYEKDWYVRRGVTPDRVEITGHPRFDVIHTLPHLTREELNRELGINSDKQMVLVATHPHEPFWVALVEHLASDSGIQVVIKPHPHEVSWGLLAEYQRMAAKWAHVKLCADGPLLYDLVPHADAVVMSSSTVGLEAMMSGKPVLALRTLGDYYDQEKLGPFTQKDPKICADTIIALLENPNLRREAETLRQQFLAYAYPHRYSSPRVAEVIEELSGVRLYNSAANLRKKVVRNAGGAVFMIDKGRKRLIAYPVILEQWGLPLDRIEQVDQAFLRSLPYGPVVSAKEDFWEEGDVFMNAGGAVFLAEDGKRRLIPSPDVLARLGYSIDEVPFIPDSFIQLLPQGPTVQGR